MNKKPSSMIACITGASRGIGYEIARHIGPLCSDLFLASKTKVKMAKASQQLTAELNCRIHSMWGDLSGGRSMGKSFQSAIEKKVDKLDLLVLNAGYYVDGKLASIADSDFEQNMKVNCLSAHYLVSSLLPLLRKSKCARIVIIGSTAAYEPYPLVPTYGVAKWALRGYAINLRKDLMADNIGVTFVSPGGTLTDMWKGVELPAGRLLEPADIAKMITAMMTLSPQAVVEELIVRPMLGDIHE
jgi:short-subunit dehydrogenase